MAQKIKKIALANKLAVKPTGKYGNGVFAKKDIAKGEVIYVLSGQRMTLNDLVRKVNSGKEYIDDPFQIGRKTYIDLDKLSRTFNHSCDPNGGLRKNSELFALKDILQGEQITYDYSLTISPTKWEMRCKCGAKNCRKILGDILSVPKVQLMKYQENGALQRYMKLLLKEIRSGKYKMPKYEILALEKLKPKK